MKRSKTASAATPGKSDSHRHHKRFRADPDEPQPEFPRHVKPKYEVHAKDVSKAYNGSDVQGCPNHKNVLMRCMEVRGHCAGGHQAEMIAALTAKAEEMMSPTITNHPEVVAAEKLEWEVSLSRDSPHTYKGVTSISKIHDVLESRLDKLSTDPNIEFSTVLRIFFWYVGDEGPRNTRASVSLAQQIVKEGEEVRRRGVEMHRQAQEIHRLEDECDEKSNQIEELLQELDMYRFGSGVDISTGCWKPLSACWRGNSDCWGKQ